MFINDLWLGCLFRRDNKIYRHVKTVTIPGVESVFNAISLEGELAFIPKDEEVTKVIDKSVQFAEVKVGKEFCWGCKIFTKTVEVVNESKNFNAVSKIGNWIYFQDYTWVKVK